MIHTVIIPILIGFCIFLFGMKIMELALHKSAGHHLYHVMQQSTTTPLHGLAIGTAATAVLQSSTAVTVMSIGLVNAGILTFPRTLGIILGTNIGTCLTTELIGLHLNRLALPLLATSLAVWLFTALIGEMGIPIPSRIQPYANRSLHTLRYSAVIIGGFSILIIGIGLMQSISPFIHSSGFFNHFLTLAKDSVVWGLAAGIVLSAIVHSSAAVVSIIMGLASAGAMPAEIGIAIVIGSNVGTCITAVLASIGGTRSGHFVAWSHVALNIGGAILFAPFAHELQMITAWMTASPSEQIARAQTLFNIASSLIALPFCYLSSLKNITSN